MTTQLDYPTAQALATLTHHLRPEWDHAGILQALRPLTTKHTATTLATAMIQAAAAPEARTPAAIHHPGPWWNHTTPQQPNPDPEATRPTASAAATRHPDPCPIDAHARIGKYAHNCPECRLVQDFPGQLDKHVYDRLDPVVQRIVDRHPNVVVLT